MYTSGRRMSLHEVKRKDPVWVSAGGLWQDAPGSSKTPPSPRGPSRALSVAYILIQDASLPQTEENLSLKCLKEACADVHAVFKTISFERISLGTTDILDSFYNAGKLRPALPELQAADLLSVPGRAQDFLTVPGRARMDLLTVPPAGPSEADLSSHLVCLSLHRRGGGGDERHLLPAVPVLPPRRAGELQHDQQRHPVLL